MLGVARTLPFDRGLAPTIGEAALFLSWSFPPVEDWPARAIDFSFELLPIKSFANGYCGVIHLSGASLPCDDPLTIACVVLE